MGEMATFEKGYGGGTAYEENARSEGLSSGGARLQLEVLCLLGTNARTATSTLEVWASDLSHRIIPSLGYGDHLYTQLTPWTSFPKNSA